MTDTSIEETELKFLITKDVAENLIDSHDVIAIKEIEQTYLFSENASVKYDASECQWIIFLKNGLERFTLYVKENKKSEAFQVLNEYKDVDLTTIPDIAMRLRQVDEKVIFTFKKKKDDISDYEFENEINSIDYSNQLLIDFLDTDSLKVKKIRYLLRVNSLIYEIDFFDKIEDIILEIEFKTQEEYLQYKADFPCINVTGDYKYSNKYIASL